MEQWEYGGGFSLDASVRIEAHDRQGLATPTAVDRWAQQLLVAIRQKAADA